MLSDKLNMESVDIQMTSPPNEPFTLQGLVTHTPTIPPPQSLQPLLLIANEFSSDLSAGLNEIAIHSIHHNFTTVESMIEQENGSCIFIK